MNRPVTGLIFGASAYAIAWSARASVLWATVVGLAAAVVAVALN
ncbi:hypothetical protein [Streptomyces sp. AMCC400023]|nr:hypothetical protein [Streptomyces sp. AMCC400023]